MEKKKKKEKKEEKKKGLKRERTENEAPPKAELRLHIQSLTLLVRSGNGGVSMRERKRKRT